MFVSVTPPAFEFHINFFSEILFQALSFFQVKQSKGVCEWTWLLQPKWSCLGITLLNNWTALQHELLWRSLRCSTNQFGPQKGKDVPLSATFTSEIETSQYHFISFCLQLEASQHARHYSTQGGNLKGSTPSSQPMEANKDSYISLVPHLLQNTQFILGWREVSLRISCGIHSLKACFDMDV